MKFHAGSLQHLAALVAIALGCLAASRLSRTRCAAYLRYALAATLLVYLGVTYARIHHGAWNWQWDLPLDLCDVIMFIACAALICPTPLLFEATYFLGLAGSGQALLTPDLARGWPSWAFIAFFWGHGMIWLTVATLVGQGMKPRRRSIWRMMLLLNVYAAIVGTLDAIFHWNYGYLMHPPPTASLIDWLGPWPWYILSIEGVALVSFVILWIPWAIVERNSQPANTPAMGTPPPSE